MNPAFATMGASSTMAVVDERARTKGDDELDPYIKCVLLPFDMEKATEDAVDAGHDPDWTGVDAKGKSIYKNRLEFVVKPKAAKKAEPAIEPRLRLEAWDEDVGVDDFLGQAVVPLWALVDEAAYQAKLVALEAKAKQARLKQFLTEAEEQKKELLDTKQGKLAATAVAVPQPPPGASPQKRRRQKTRRMSTSLFEGQRTSTVGTSAPAPGAAIGAAEVPDEEDEEDEFDGIAEEVHEAEEVLDLERAERLVERDPSANRSPPAPLDLQPLPPLDPQRARKSPGDSPKERRGGLPPQTLPLWSMAPRSDSNNSPDVDPSRDNHRLTDGAVKRLELTTRKGDKHVGWIEVKISWQPDEAAIASIDPESRGSPRNGTSSPRKGKIIGRPMVGKLIVEVLRGEGLNLCEEQGTTSAAADPVLFTMALITLLSYVILGGIFYVLNEEHCDELVIPGLPLTTASTSGADSDGDGLITVTELTEWGQPNAPPPVCHAWTVVDAAYFTVVTFTTIGYGDFGPSNSGSKVFTAFFALLGVTLIGAACGIVVGYFMEQLDMQLQKAAELAKLDDSKEYGLDEDDDEAEEGTHKKPSGNKIVPIPSAMDKQEAIARQKMANKRKAIYVNFGHLVVTFAVGMLLFHAFGNGEDMTFIDIFYAAVITSCSVGYGDYSFDTQTGRGLCTLYAIGAVPMVAKFVGGVSSYIIDAKQEQLVQAALKRKLKHSDLLDMDEDGDGQVDRGEFLAKMLVKLGKASQDDIDEILAQFDILDEDGSGFLDSDDLALLKAREQAHAAAAAVQAAESA